MIPPMFSGYNARLHRLQPARVDNTVRGVVGRPCVVSRSDRGHGDVHLSIIFVQRGVQDLRVLVRKHLTFLLNECAHISLLIGIILWRLCRIGLPVRCHERLQGSFSIRRGQASNIPRADGTKKQLPSVLFILPEGDVVL